MRFARSLFCVALLLALAAPSSLKAKSPDVLFYVNVKAFPQTAFARQLTSLPEWEPFRTLFGEAVDKGIRNELNNRQRLEKVLPPKFVDLIAKTVVGRELSFLESTELMFRHLDAAVFMADVGDLSGFNGAFTVLLDIDPTPWLAWLRMVEDFREASDYTWLKNESDGEFIIKTTFRHLGQKIEFCCAGLKLPGNSQRYAVLFSDEANIQRYCEAFKSGQTGEEYAAEYLKKLVVGDRCFRFLEELGKQQKWSERITEVCAKIRGVEVGLRDVDGATQVEVRLSLRQMDDAKAAYGMLLGAVALVPVPTDARGITNFLQTINIVVDETDIRVIARLDHPDLWSLLSGILVKVSDGIRKK